MDQNEVDIIFAQIIDDNYEYVAPQIQTPTPPMDQGFMVIPTDSNIFELLIAILLNTEDGTDYGI